MRKASTVSGLEKGAEILAEKVYVTGDGVCPWCGKLVIADKPETHHVHFLVPKGKLKE